MKRLSPLILVALLCLLGLAAGGHSAESPAPDQAVSPIEFLTQHDGHAKELIPVANDSLTTQKRQQVKEHINGAFDFTELSQRALGQHWDELDPAERQRFTDTFSAIIAEKNFDSFLRYYRDGSIEYRSQEQDGSEAAVIAEVPLKGRD